MGREREKIKENLKILMISVCKTSLKMELIKHNKEGKGKGRRKGLEREDKEHTVGSTEHRIILQRYLKKVS